MSSRPSSPSRPRTPPRPRSPITTTFQIRGGSSYFNHELTLTNDQYDELLRQNPEAALSYIDDDDGDLIMVGSGNELHARVLELLAYPPPPPPAIFDIEPASQDVWQRLLEKGTSSKSAPKVSSRTADVTPRSYPELQHAITEQSSFVEKNVLETESPPIPDKDAVKTLVENRDTSPPSLPLTSSIIDNQSPFIASFEAEINKILEEVLSQAGTPRALSPKPQEPRDENESHDQDKVHFGENLSIIAPQLCNDVTGLRETERTNEAGDENSQRENPAAIVADVFNSVLKTITRVAQDATAQAARTFPQHFTQADSMSSASRSLEAFNNAVQDVLVKFTAQLHTLASEAVISAQDPQSRPGHPAAIFRNLAETVGHLAVENASKIREEIRFAGADAGAEARRAAEDLKKAADEVRKAAQIVGQEFGKTGRVMGKIAGGAGKEVGKAFGNGAGFVSGFAGGIVRNLTGSTRQSAFETSDESVESDEVDETVIATDKKEDEVTSKYISDIMNGLPSSFGSVSAPRAIPGLASILNSLEPGGPQPLTYLDTFPEFLSSSAYSGCNSPAMAPAPLLSEAEQLPGQFKTVLAPQHVQSFDSKDNSSERCDPLPKPQYPANPEYHIMDPFLRHSRSTGSWGGFGRTNGRAGQNQFVPSGGSKGNEADAFESSRKLDFAVPNCDDKHTYGKDFSDVTSGSHSSDSEEETLSSSMKPKRSGYCYVDPGLTRSEREAWRAKWRSARENGDSCHPSRRGAKFQYHFRPHVLGSQMRTARYGRRRRGSFSDDKLTSNASRSDRGETRARDYPHDSGQNDKNHKLQDNEESSSFSLHMAMPDRDDSNYVKYPTPYYPFRLENESTHSTNQARARHASYPGLGNGPSFLDSSMRDLYELPAHSTKQPYEKKVSEEDTPSVNRRYSNECLSLSSSINASQDFDIDSKSIIHKVSDVFEHDDDFNEKNVDNSNINHGGHVAWMDDYMGLSRDRSSSPYYKLPGEGEIRRSATISDPTFPALTKARTTSDAFDKGKGVDRPWLGPWQKTKPLERGTFNEDDVMARFPSLAELGSALPSLENLETLSSPVQQLGPLDDLPTPSSLTSSLQNAFPAMTPMNINHGSDTGTPKQSSDAITELDILPVQASLGHSFGYLSPLLSIPGGFPVDDTVSNTSSETVRANVLPRRIETRTFSQIARDEAIETLRRELAIKSEREERERQQLVELDLAPKIVDCVKMMMEMGYSEMGIDHLGHIAEMVNGNLEEAIDAVDEERQAWDRIKLGAEQ